MSVHGEGKLDIAIERSYFSVFYQHSEPQNGNEFYATSRQFVLHLHIISDKIFLRKENSMYMCLYKLCTKLKNYFFDVWVTIV